MLINIIFTNINNNNNNILLLSLFFENYLFIVTTKVIFMISLQILEYLKDDLIGCEDEGGALSIVNHFIKRISGRDPKMFLAKNLDNDEYLKVDLEDDAKQLVLSSLLTLQQY